VKPKPTSYEAMEKKNDQLSAIRRNDQLSPEGDLPENTCRLIS